MEEIRRVTGKIEKLLKKVDLVCKENDIRWKESDLRIKEMELRRKEMQLEAERRHESIFVCQIAYEAEKQIICYILRGTGLTYRDVWPVRIWHLYDQINWPRRTGFFGDFFTTQDQIDKANANWDRLGNTVSRILKCECMGSNCYCILYLSYGIEALMGHPIYYELSTRDVDQLHQRVCGLKHVNEQVKNKVLQILAALSLLWQPNLAAQAQP